jgi:hypothetical protein
MTDNILKISATEDIYIDAVLNITASTGSNSFISNQASLSINLATSVVLNKISGPDALINQGDKITFQRTVVHPNGIPV